MDFRLFYTIKIATFDELSNIFEKPKNSNPIKTIQIRKFQIAINLIIIFRKSRKGSHINSRFQVSLNP